MSYPHDPTGTGAGDDRSERQHTTGYTDRFVYGETSPPLPGAPYSAHGRADGLVDHSTQARNGQPSQTSGMAIAALVLGVFSLAGMMFIGPFSLLAALVGYPLTRTAAKEVAQPGVEGEGLVTAAKVTNLVGLALLGLGILIVLILIMLVVLFGISVM